MGHIPGRKQDRFYEKKLVVELVAVLPALVTAAVGALVNLADPAKRTLGWWLAGATAWLALASVVKVLHAAAQDRERKRGEDYAGLRGALHVLYECIRRGAGVHTTGDGTLRATIYRAERPAVSCPAGQELEQLLPYIGGIGGAPGRRFSIRTGIIGKAAREKRLVAVDRKSKEYPEFVEELVCDWGYTEEEAHAIRSDRQTWMGVPVLGPDQSVAAVVYLDSSVPGFFSEDVQQLVGNLCSGVAAYIAEAY